MTAPQPADPPLYLSVVAPCYNETEVLPELCRRVTAACAAVPRTYELVLVNDGSTDGTWDAMRAMAARDHNLVAVSLSRNHGHQLALAAGLSVCRGERILIIDADLQDPPELLPEMLAAMDRERADVVYGQRRRRIGEKVWKRATAAAFYRIIERLTDTKMPRDTGDFRLMTRRALNVLLSMPERHRFVRGMVSWIGFRQVPLLYDRQARAAGESHYPWRRMFTLAIDAVVALSIKPLRLASWVAAMTLGVSLLVIGYSVFAYLRGNPASVTVSLIGAIGFFSGTQMLVLGVMGEYLGRLYEQSQGRPLFLIDEVVRQAASTNADAPLPHAIGR